MLLVEGEPHHASIPVLIESGVLERLLVAAYTFHLSADPRSAQLTGTGLRHWVDTVLVPVVNAIRAPASAIYPFQTWCSSQIEPGCGSSAPEPRAEGFIVMLISTWEDLETVCACDVCGRDGGWRRLTFRRAR